VPSRLWTWTRPRLPVLLFTATYVVTCYVGLLALVFSPRFRALYLIFSGADVPDLTWRDLIVGLGLAHIGPLFLWTTYALVVRSRRIVQGLWPGFLARIADAQPSLLVVRCLFVLSAAGALWSIERAGGVGMNLSAWLDYNSYVYARYRVYDRLTFFEFVNLYTWLPLFCTYLVLLDKRTVVVPALALVAMLECSLASRKPLLAAAIVMASSFYVYRYVGSRPRRPLRPLTHVTIILVGPVCLFLAYLGLTAVTVIRPTSSAFQSIESLVPREQLEAARRRRALRELRRREQAALPALQRIALISDIDAAMPEILKNRASSATLYVLLSPFTRTSVTALTYPAIFPQEHPFYPLDLGLDVLRIGTMPDENLVAYRILWPFHHRGAVGAPFQVVLYTQGGVWIACVGALGVGALLSGAWLFVSRADRPPASTAAIAGLIMLFSAFVAIDSVRNSLIVSYGVAWGILAVLLVSAVAWAFRVRDDRAET
jgi:hypothetical protein